MPIDSPFLATAMFAALICFSSVWDAFDFLEGQRVVAHLHRLARLKLRLSLGLERSSGEPDDDEHDAEVHDVAAVAPSVSQKSSRQRARPRELVARAVNPAASPELRDDRGPRERRQSERKQRADATNAQETEDRDGRHSDEQWESRRCGRTFPCSSVSTR